MYQILGFNNTKIVMRHFKILKLVEYIDKNI